METIIETDAEIMGLEGLPGVYTPPPPPPPHDASDSKAEYTNAAGGAMDTHGHTEAARNAQEGVAENVPPTAEQEAGKRDAFAALNGYRKQKKAHGNGGASASKEKQTQVSDATEATVAAAASRTAEDDEDASSIETIDGEDDGLDADEDERDELDVLSAQEKKKALYRLKKAITDAAASGEEIDADTLEDYCEMVRGAISDGVVSVPEAKKLMEAVQKKGGVSAGGKDDAEDGGSSSSSESGGEEDATDESFISRDEDDYVDDDDDDEYEDDEEEEEDDDDDEEEDEDDEEDDEDDEDGSDDDDEEEEDQDEEEESGGGDGPTAKKRKVEKCRRRRRSTQEEADDKLIGSDSEVDFGIASAAAAATQPLARTRLSATAASFYQTVYAAHEEEILEKLTGAMAIGGGGVAPGPMTAAMPFASKSPMWSIPQVVSMASAAYLGALYKAMPRDKWGEIIKRLRMRLTTMSLVLAEKQSLLLKYLMAFHGLEAAAPVLCEALAAMGDYYDGVAARFADIFHECSKRRGEALRVILYMMTKAGSIREEADAKGTLTCVFTGDVATRHVVMAFYSDITDGESVRESLARQKRRPGSAAAAADVDATVSTSYAAYVDAIQAYPLARKLVLYDRDAGEMRFGVKSLEEYESVCRIMEWRSGTFFSFQFGWNYMWQAVAADAGAGSASEECLPDVVSMTSFAMDLFDKAAARMRFLATKAVFAQEAQKNPECFDNPNINDNLEAVGDAVLDSLLQEPPPPQEAGEGGSADDAVVVVDDDA